MSKFPYLPISLSFVPGFENTSKIVSWSYIKVLIMVKRAIGVNRRRRFFQGALVLSWSTVPSGCSRSECMRSPFLRSDSFSLFYIALSIGWSSDTRRSAPEMENSRGEGSAGGGGVRSFVASLTSAEVAASLIGRASLTDLYEGVDPSHSFAQAPPTLSHHKGCLCP